MEIGKFRRLMAEKLAMKKSKQEILKFIDEYLYVDENAANAIYEYFKEQFDYIKKIPNDKQILVEYYNDGDPRNSKIMFHSLFGRRVNDCLSRAVAYAVYRQQHKDVEIGINDNGFYVAGDKKVMAISALKLIKSDKLELVLNAAISKSEVFKRRFRHCATRALMILRNYLGRTKHVGRQQVSSQILLSALNRISTEFTIIKEARREVLEDLMDIEHTKQVLKEIEEGKMKIVEVDTKLPSPFAFNIALQGHFDILKIEDKHEFLRRMHQYVLAKIGMKCPAKIDGSGAGSPGSDSHSDIVN
jgi:ATP-dependent Lhr-like helicase